MKLCIKGAFSFYIRNWKQAFPKLSSRSVSNVIIFAYATDLAVFARRYSKLIGFSYFRQSYRCLMAVFFVRYQFA